MKLDRIGDMVNTTPVFDFLRERYPQAQLDIVGHPVALSLLDADPRVSGRFRYESSLYHGAALRAPGPAAWRLVRTLWATRYGLVVYLRGSFPFLLLAMRSRFLAAKFVQSEPVIRRYLKTLGAAYAAADPVPQPSLYVSAAGRKQVLAKYPNWGLRPSVVIHAVSAAAGKQWPLERFAPVADQVATLAKAQVLFLATPADADKMTRIRSLCKQPHSFETAFRLPAVVAAIAQADVFIGNDSGLAHIAAGVQTPEVVIWGAADLNMARPAAPRERCTILYREVVCRAGCPEIRCVGPEHLRCLLDIHVTDVVAAALGYLSNARVPIRSS